MIAASLAKQAVRLFRQKHAVLRIAVFLSLGMTGTYFIAFAVPTDTWAWYCFWTLARAFVLFCWTSCFHECAHQTLTKTPCISIALGRLLGTVMFVPYTAYRESHIRHHAYLNKPSDWELWPYSDPHKSKAFRRIFAWFDLLLGAIVAPYIYGRIYLDKQSPLKTQVRQTIRNEYLAIVVFWSAAIALLTYFHVWLIFAELWLIPHLIAGVFQTARKFTEHLGMASFDPILGTRTVMGPGWLTRLCCFVNFDIFIHGPHHRFPRAAHNQLGDKIASYLQGHPDVEFPLYKSYLRAAADAIPYLFANPGVGLNAGATTAGKTGTATSRANDTAPKLSGHSEEWQGLDEADKLVDSWTDFAALDIRFFQC